MKEFIYEITNNLAVISFLLPFFISILTRKGLIQMNLPLLILIALNLFFVILEVVFSYVLQNCHPIYHVSIFVSTILTFSYFIKSSLSPKISIILILLTIGIFFYETVYLNRIFYNNYSLTIFSNVSISLISLFNLFKLS